MHLQLKADGEARALLATGLQQQLQEAEARLDDAKTKTPEENNTTHMAWLQSLASKAKDMADIITQVSRVLSRWRACHTAAVASVSC